MYHTNLLINTEVSSLNTYSQQFHNEMIIVRGLKSVIF